MPGRSWKKRWLDPTLHGRRTRWLFMACVAFQIATFLFVPRDSTFRRVYGGNGILMVVGVYVSALTWYFAFHRRLVKQANAMDFRMCQFCGYDLRSIDEPGPCPECGHKFEVADLRDYWVRKFEGRS